MPISDADRTKMMDIFDCIDANNDGFISLDELKVKFRDKAAEEWLALIDANKDGKISKEEWLKFMATWAPDSEELKEIHRMFCPGKSPMSPIFLIGVAAALAFVIYIKTRK